MAHFQRSLLLTNRSSPEKDGLPGQSWQDGLWRCGAWAPFAAAPDRQKPSTLAHERDGLPGQSRQDGL